MKVKKAVYIMIAVAIIGVAVGVFFSRKMSVTPDLSGGIDQTPVVQGTATTYAHFYGNPSENLENIDLDVFYVVPKDAKVSDLVGDNLPKIFDEMANFHKSQFSTKSNLTFWLYHQPVILENESHFYDTDNTAFGNPEALKSITLELERRVFDPKGDLFSKDFVTPAGHFRDIAIIYEGVGAAGTEGSLLLSRDFITRDEYASVSSAIFYHEFGHTIGLLEGYDVNTPEAKPFTNDIMGSGRRAPLKTNYIDQSSLKQMGVL